MPEYPVRKNPRLRTWDYAGGGTYFITVCTKDHRHTLSAVPGGGAAPQVRLTPLGELAERYLASVPGIQTYVVMPNHVHFLVTLEGGGGPMKASAPTPGDGNGPMRASAPTPGNGSGPMRASAPTLAGVVRSFKALVTKAWGGPVWQRGYYDHIVRNQDDFLRIWSYIDQNPQKWELDRYYTER